MRHTVAVKGPGYTLADLHTLLDDLASSHDIDPTKVRVESLALDSSWTGSSMTLTLSWSTQRDEPEDSEEVLGE